MKTLRDIVKGNGDNILATSAICGVERQLGSGRVLGLQAYLGSILTAISLNHSQPEPL
jgi:hypothetical protein